MVWGSRIVTLVVVAGLLVVAFPTPARANPGKYGTIKDLFPPGSYGFRHGAGQITEDGTGTVYVFQTPDDVTLDPRSPLLKVGDRVTFENPSGRQATDVMKIAP